MNIDSIANRIRQIRSEIGNPSQEAFGKPLSITKSAVGQWENGKTEPSAETILKIERIYGYRAQWIQTGELPKLVREMGRMTNEPSNIIPAESPGRVPILSWVNAGEWREAMSDASTFEGWAHVTVQVRRYTFALRVHGDSMEPDFPAGVFIVVEPDMDPQPGDFVIAINGEEATFKQLVKDGADWYLKPLNPRYPIKPLESPCKIIGVVREQVRRYR
jgi:SOS-response transcriptional repressor LexA